MSKHGISTMTLAQLPTISDVALHEVQGGFFNPFPIAFDSAYRTANVMEGNTRPEDKRSFMGDLNQARKNLGHKPQNTGSNEIERTHMAPLILTAARK
jgi:hypothetical protein